MAGGRRAGTWASVPSSPRPTGPRGWAETDAPASGGGGGGCIAGEEPCVFDQWCDRVAFSPEGGAVSVFQGSISILEKAVQRQGPESSATSRRLPPGPASDVHVTVTWGRKSTDLNTTDSMGKSGYPKNPTAESSCCRATPSRLIPHREVGNFHKCHLRKCLAHCWHAPSV